MSKYWFCEKPAILVEAEKAKMKFHPVLLVVLFLLFTSVLMHYLNSSSVIAFSPSGDSPDSVVKLFILACLFYLIPLSLFLFFVKFVEKRSWASMGFVKNKSLKIYLILVGVFIAASFLITSEMGKTILDMSTEIPLFAVLVAATIYCQIVITYGFLLISLANRISMKNAVIVVALIPVILFAIDVITILIDASHTAPMNVGVSSILIKDALSTVASILFTAAYALLLLRTNHIWSVAILALLFGIRLNLLPFPYMQIVLIVVAAAILYAVLFWPKKTLEKQEGAGFVSQ